MKLTLLFVLLVAAVIAQTVSTPPTSPRVEPLWPVGEVPLAQGMTDVDQPSISIWLPTGIRTRTAVIVFPGGGYQHLALDHEGAQVARWLNDRGVAAFVVTYRLGPKYHYPAQLLDAQRAIRMVRSRAAEFGVLPDRIGVWGFSAGGHLASTVSTHFEDKGTKDGIAGSARPDFAVLAYPVIQLGGPFYHGGSLRNLLGPDPDPNLVRLLSNETQVTASTPPTFLFHTADDTSVPSQNSVLYYLALRAQGVAAELHVYQHGKHGVGLAPSDPVLGTWPGRLEDWMRINGWLTPPEAPRTK